MLQNIPLELRRLPQWVAVNSETKAPLCPHTRKPASPTDSRTWGTFEQAKSTGKEIGFVFTESDPYCVIDLDVKPGETPKETIDRHKKIFSAFDSYAEVSRSGNGVHIIFKAKLSSGRRRDSVEIYPHNRYMIMTGRVCKRRPITEQQELAEKLWQEIGHVHDETELQEIAEKETDQEVIEKAERAVNSDKFRLLWQGGWEKDYPSQSEADFGLVSMLARYTESNAQVIRLFHESCLSRQKTLANDSSQIKRMLRKIRAEDEKLNEVDLTEFLERIKKAGFVEIPVPTIEPVRPHCKATAIAFPPGLVGEIAAWAYSSAWMPVREFALAAAIGWVAGVAGRAYNTPTGYGLQQFLAVISGTGKGKEGINDAIGNLFSYVEHYHKRPVPAVRQFIGPGGFASKQGMVKALNRSPAFVCVVTEFADELERMTSIKASQHTRDLKTFLTEVFSKSGWNKYIGVIEHAQEKDNTRTVRAPNATLICETAPDKFYNLLSEEMIADGFLPRFSFIEYNGPRVYENPNAGIPPSDSLLDKASELSTIALAQLNSNNVHKLRLDGEAQAIFAKFSKEMTDRMNLHEKSSPTVQLGNRAHLKALKLASLVAVGVDPHEPVIDAVAAQWSIAFIRRDMATILKKFGTGDIGTGEYRQEADFRQAFEHYFTMTQRQQESYKVPWGLQGKPVVPLCYLRRKLRTVKSFREDRRGSAEALNKLLTEMQRAGLLIQVKPEQALAEFKTTSPIYVKGESW